MRCYLSRQVRRLEPLGPRPDLSHAAVKRRPDKSLGGGSWVPLSANATFDDSVRGDRSTQPQRSGIAEKFGWACMGPQELINHLNTVRKCRVPVSKSMQRASWHASDSIATGYHILLVHRFSADRTHASTMTSVVAFHVAATCAI